MPQLRQLFRAEKLDQVVCGHCGLSRWFVPSVLIEQRATTNSQAGASVSLPDSASSAAGEDRGFAQALTRESLAVADAAWDDRTALLFLRASDKTEPAHDVRASAWYALGLMARDDTGDRARSLQAFRAVLARQLHQPGAAWDGTFIRTADEAPPPANAELWKHYDPNWRQFIGTVLAMALIEFGDRIPEADQRAMESAIRRAVEGENQHARLRHTYTNVAIMHAFLLSFAGQRLNEPRWVTDGETWTEAIHNAFRENMSFPEFNSPTYYGVDFFGLSLLRRYGSTALLREHGATMEEALWRDTAQFYHAGFRNLAGPFDRAYGMDMQRYVSLVGVWLGLVFPRDVAPLPAPGEPMGHAGDFLCAPTYAIVGTRIPDDAMRQFAAFEGERFITRKIADGTRVATSWLGQHVMIGAEATALTRRVVLPHGQFHPATIHWQQPDGRIGWAALRQSPLLDATAAENQLTLSAKGDSMFRIFAGAPVDMDSVTGTAWDLPGLRVQIETDASRHEVVRNESFIEVTYRDATTIVLRTTVPHTE